MNYIKQYEYKQINSDFLVVDQNYQRGLSMARVKRIVARFNPQLVNPVKASFRDGKYYVFDGQHTLAALKMRNGGRPLMVECKVYRGLTETDEAKLFAEQNGLSRQVETSARIKALYAAGDPEIVSFVQSTTVAGIQVPFSSHGAENRLVAVSKALKIYRRYGQFFYIEVLNIIKDAWGGHRDSLRAEILGGVALFYHTYQGRFQRKHLIESLSRISPLRIIQDGRAFNGSSGDKRFALQILNQYNRGKRLGKLEPEFGVDR